jgi:4-diphosphocytidyl-2-C-methyl-D-erythritol kinase
MTTTIIERAPAKINLYLHVTGKREDGYHLLDSLAVFAKDGNEAADIITLRPADGFSLSIDGPYAVSLQGEDVEKNLITKALRVYSNASGNPLNLALTLTKNLPVASGIGGGSSDAAAALRAVAKFHGVPETHPALLEGARSIGADGTVCYYGKPTYMRGTGDELEPVNDLPRTWLLLANPNIPLPTAAVYKAREGAYLTQAPLNPMPASALELAEALSHRHNSLEAPALKLCEPIADVLDVLSAQAGCLLVRLSGSGATCFGVFETKEEAEKAKAHMRSQIGEWWLAVTGF